MKSSKKPQKPLRNPSHFVLSKSQAVRRVEEELPREQEALELTVGRKYLGALRHFKGIQLSDLRRGPEPADLQCRSPDGNTIGLQIVEVVNEELRQLRQMRSSYRNALVEILGQELLLFNGCRVSLGDSGDEQLLPPASSRDGQICLADIANYVRTVAEEIHTLEVGKIRSRTTNTRNPQRKISVAVHRVHPAEEPLRMGFSWDGAGPAYRTDVSRGLLTKAVQSKIAKRYSRPTATSFRLLAYSVDTQLRPDDPDVFESNYLLESSQHPFDEAWFIYLYAARELGSLIQVWSRLAATV